MWQKKNMKILYLIIFFLSNRRMPCHLFMTDKTWCRSQTILWVLSVCCISLHMTLLREWTSTKRVRVSKRCSLLNVHHVRFYGNLVVKLLIKSLVFRFAESWKHFSNSNRKYFSVSNLTNVSKRIHDRTDIQMNSQIPVYGVCYVCEANRTVVERAKKTTAPREQKQNNKTIDHLLTTNQP